MDLGSEDDIELEPEEELVLELECVEEWRILCEEGGLAGQVEEHVEGGAEPEVDRGHRHGACQESFRRAKYWCIGICAFRTITKMYDPLGAPTSISLVGLCPRFFGGE